MGSIPGQGIKILHATWHDQKNFLNLDLSFFFFWFTGSSLLCVGSSLWFPDLQLWHTGLVALQPKDLSFLTRDQTCILFIGRWILNHWTTREVSDPAVLGLDFKRYHQSNTRKDCFNDVQFHSLNKSTPEHRQCSRS